jgi:hypothetical protein
LNGVEEQAVILFENGEHRFSGHRSPATEHYRDLIFFEQFLRLLREKRPVGRRINDDRLELLAE